MERITERQDGEDTPHYNPIFVAEGDAVLFAVNVGETPHIRSVDLSSGEVDVLVVGGVRPRYMRTGHLVYLTPGGDLTAAPFDASNMALTGAGVPVIRGVAFNRTYSPLVISENGTLVYTRGTGARRYQAVWVDRDGGASPIDPEWRFDPGGSMGLSLSPDGARLAVTIMGDVWVKELPQGPLTRLTFGSGPETRPRWTADGRVTYVSVQEGPGALHARQADGTGSADLLLSHERQIWEGILSDDVEWVIARVGQRLSVAGQAPGMDVIGMRPARDTEATVLIATSSTRGPSRSHPTDVGSPTCPTRPDETRSTCGPFPVSTRARPRCPSTVASCRSGRGAARRYST